MLKPVLEGHVLSHDFLKRCLQVIPPAIDIVQSTGTHSAQETAATEAERQIGAVQAGIIFPQVKIGRAHV